jgi:hypothetical protein
MLEDVVSPAVHRKRGVTMPCTITIKDRNCSAFLMVNGFTPVFIARADNSTVDAEFEWSEDLDRTKMDYISNRGVPVQSFIAACRHIGEEIKRHHQRRGGRL